MVVGNVCELLLGCVTDALLVGSIDNLVVSFHKNGQKVMESLSSLVLNDEEEIGEEFGVEVFNEAIGWQVLLVDIVSEVANLKIAGIFLCHGLDTLPNSGELFHVLADLLILLVHLLLDGDGKFVQGTLGRVPQTLPSEVTDVLRVRSSSSCIVGSVG